MKKEIEKLEKAVNEVIDTYYNKELKQDLQDFEKSAKRFINQIGEKTMEALEKTTKSLKKEESGEKKLVYSYDKNSLHFLRVVDKNDLEKYVEYYISEFINTHKSRTKVYNYRAHDISSNMVTIEFEVQTQVGLHSFSNSSHLETLYFVSMDNIPTWKPEAQAQPSKENQEVENKTKYMRDHVIEPPIQADVIPTFIKIDNINFMKHQILDIPTIRYNPVYTDYYDEDSFFIQNGRTLIRYDYGSIEMKVRATTLQMEAIRENLNTELYSTNPSKPRKVNKIVLIEAIEGKDIQIEGYIRDLSFVAYDLKNAPTHLDLTICFVISKINSQ